MTNYEAKLYDRAVFLAIRPRKAFIFLNNVTSMQALADAIEAANGPSFIACYKGRPFGAAGFYPTGKESAEAWAIMSFRGLAHFPFFEDACKKGLEHGYHIHGYTYIVARVRQSWIKSIAWLETLGFQRSGVLSYDMPEPMVMMEWVPHV